MPEKLRNEYENKINKFLKKDGKVSLLRLFLLSFAMLSASGVCTYYDYFLDGDDYIFFMLPIATIAAFILTLLSIFAIIVNFFKKK